MIRPSLVLAILALAFTGWSHESAATPLAQPKIGDGVLAALDAGSQVRVLVRLHDPAAINANAPTRASAVARAQTAVLSQLSPNEFTPLRRYTYVPGLAGTITRAGLNALQAHPLVAAIEIDEPTEVHLSESVPALGANIVHTTYHLTGQGVTVAILDSGIDTDHPDLRDDIVAQHCYTHQRCPPDNTNEGSSAEDENGHGTNVAGIITSNGTVSSVGFAPDAQIVAVRVLDASGSGYVSDWIAGLDWLLGNLDALNIRVVNMSLGTKTLYTGACDAQQSLSASAISQLVAADVVVFASTGNQGSSTSLASPACISTVIAVGATYDSNLGREPDGLGSTYFSMYGLGWPVCYDASTSSQTITCFTNSNAMMDLVAPGARITASGKGGGLSTFIGTSQAAPVAAGVAALLLQANSRLPPADIETALKTTGTPVTDPKNGLQFPAVNALNAVKAVIAALPHQLYLPSILRNSAARQTRPWLSQYAK